MRLDLLNFIKNNINYIHATNVIDQISAILRTFVPLVNINTDVNRTRLVQTLVQHIVNSQQFHLISVEDLYTLSDLMRINLGLKFDYNKEQWLQLRNRDSDSIQGISRSSFSGSNGGYGESALKDMRDALAEEMYEIDQSLKTLDKLIRRIQSEESLSGASLDEIPLSEAASLGEASQSHEISLSEAASLSQASSSRPHEELLTWVNQQANFTHEQKKALFLAGGKLQNLLHYYMGVYADTFTKQAGGGSTIVKKRIEYALDFTYHISAAFHIFAPVVHLGLAVVKFCEIAGTFISPNHAPQVSHIPQLPSDINYSFVCIVNALRFVGYDGTQKDRMIRDVVFKQIKAFHPVMLGLTDKGRDNFLQAVTERAITDLIFSVVERREEYYSFDKLFCVVLPKPRAIELVGGRKLNCNDLIPYTPVRASDGALYFNPFAFNPGKILFFHFLDRDIPDALKVLMLRWRAEDGLTYCGVNENEADWIPFIYPEWKERYEAWRQGQITNLKQKPAKDIIVNRREIRFYLTAIMFIYEFIDTNRIVDYSALIGSWLENYASATDQLKNLCKDGRLKPVKDQVLFLASIGKNYAEVKKISDIPKVDIMLKTHRSSLLPSFFCKVLPTSSSKKMEKIMRCIETDEQRGALVV